MFKLNQDANDRFLVGDPIDDEELQNPLSFYKELEAGLEQLGKEFKLPRKEVTFQRQKLESYKQAREKR